MANLHTSHLFRLTKFPHLRKPVVACLAGVSLLLMLGHAWAVINVGLQPYDLYHSRYDRVFVLQIEQIDVGASELRCSLLKTFKGAADASSELRLSFDPALSQVLAEAVEDGDIGVGDPIAVFAGRKRASREFMLYANAWYLGSATEPAVMHIDKTSQLQTGLDGEQISTLAGTWNGSTVRLVEMLEDIAAGQDHFPRKAYVRFREDVLLDRLSAPITALAMYDLEGDGDEDLVVCSQAGDRIYLQVEPLRFANATAAFGIDSASSSCAVADVNGDGLNDLLLGAVLHLGQYTDNRFYFQKTDFLPASLAHDLKTATFVEFDGDGYPDVLASVAHKGLQIFRNPAKQPGPFLDITGSLGLDTPACGAGANAYVTPGDWNKDGQLDLFLATGRGLLLAPNTNGVFEPVPHQIDFKFTSGPDDTEGLTGAGVFLPLLDPNQLELVAPLDDGWVIVANEGGQPVDITRWGNEISEGSNDHGATIAEDFNLDGHIDFFTGSRAENGHNRYIVNRGYGSFMLAPVHKHYEHVFKGPASERGGTALVSGDLNDDGAPDLVLGNAHGEVTLILNDTLVARQPIEYPPREIATLEKTRLLQVRVMGTKGVVNARLDLIDTAGRLVARRDLGLNVAGGSYGPNRVTFAVRQPDHYQLRVRYADGFESLKKIDLTGDSRVTVDVDRGEKIGAGGW
jgi:hypothetical protein